MTCSVKNFEPITIPDRCGSLQAETRQIMLSKEREERFRKSVRYMLVALFIGEHRSLAQARSCLRSDDAQTALQESQQKIRQDG
jgi:hypothetical protein